MNVLAIYGIMKSGNHLFIRWYIENLIRMYYTEEQIYKMGIKFFLDDFNPRFILEDKIVYLNDITNVYELPITLSGTPEHLILSVEDEYKRIKINDTVANTKRIFIFRSLSNLIASQLKAPEKDRIPHRFIPVDDVMKRYEKLYNCYKKHGGILVCYDKFITDSNYEAELAEQLGIKLIKRVKDFDRITHNLIPGKSSFDDHDYNNRHKHLDPEIREKINNFVAMLPEPLRIVSTGSL